MSQPCYLSKALERLRQTQGGDRGSAITYAELRFAIENSSRPEENMERLERFLLPFGWSPSILGRAGSTTGFGLSSGGLESSSAATIYCSLPTPSASE